MSLFCSYDCDELNVRKSNNCEPCVPRSLRRIIIGKYHPFYVVIVVTKETRQLRRISAARACNRKSDQQTQPL